jgi:hypothetical protein
MDLNKGASGRAALAATLVPISISTAAAKLGREVKHDDTLGFACVTAEVPGISARSRWSPTLPELNIEGFGSMPMRSLTADEIRWVQPR